jgi:Peptidase family M23
MRYALRVALPALTTASLCLALGSTPAQGVVAGGAQAPSAPLAGGSEYGVSTTLARPVLSRLSMATTTTGAPPRLVLRVDETGVGTVNVQVTLSSLSTHEPVIVVRMGWVHTGRNLTVTWPKGRALAPGSYQLSLSAHDHNGSKLLAGAHDAVQAHLKITVQAKPTPPPVSGATLPPGVPTPAQSAAAGAVFPVAGAHSFGGPENRFGAPRSGYLHQGQDVLTAEGTPVVLPMAGTILTTSYQAGGAGYYAVEHTSVGFDFMFAHCQAGSLAVSTGQGVTAGQQLCKAGQTGDATAPHLHFEMWVGGWQAAGGYPIDPLPYLEAWDRVGTAG